VRKEQPRATRIDCVAVMATAFADHFSVRLTAHVGRPCRIGGASLQKHDKCGLEAHEFNPLSPLLSTPV
jgi:hypothetical protein